MGAKQSVDEKTQALVDAALDGDLKAVRRLVRWGGASVDAKGRYGWTALTAAASAGKPDVVRLLIDHGADVTAAANFGWTATMYAACGGKTDVVRLLVGRGADVAAVDKYGKTALMYAARAGKTGVARALVELGANVGAADNDEKTVLMYAARGGEVDVVRLLVDLGAAADAIDNDGKSALVHGVEEGKTDVVQYLVEVGADVAGVDKSGETALMYGARWGRMEIVSLLVDRGADVATVDKGGKTALMYAAKGGETDVVMLLVELGADVDAVDKSGKTALMYAAMKGKRDVVQLLAELGADVSVEDGAGWTALFYCSSRGHDGIHRFLAPLVEAAQQRSIGAKQDGRQEPTTESTSSWLISPFEIELLNLIKGEGVGVQFRAKWLDAEVAVKLFIPGASRSSFVDEVATWRHLRHPNVIKLYGACDVGHFFFVSELASNGSIVEHLAACRRNGVKCTPWKFLHEAALGLAFLHERKIVHGDLRGSNILVGNDGLVKLAKFALSGSTTASGLAGLTESGVFGARRWQSLERLIGDEATSASDVYSLGLCIVEAVTGKIPWSDEIDEFIFYRKRDWDPAVNTRSDDAPGTLSDDVVGLLVAMCARDPAQRVSAAVAAQMLERLASNEHSGTSQQPEADALTTIDGYKGGELRRVWDSLHARMVAVGVDTIQRHAWDEIQAVYEHIGQASRPWKVVYQFHRLLVDIDVMLRTDSYENQIQRLSSTRATGFAMDGIRRRLDALWASIDGSEPSRRESQKQLWREARAKQLDLFVSEVEQTLLVINDLATEEDRVALLAILESEKDNPKANYTVGQLSVIHKAIDELVQRQRRDQDASKSDALTTTPEWFIPWYELEIDNANCVGTGGFGCVYRARWLESEVVVKLLDQAGSGGVINSLLASNVLSYWSTAPRALPSDSTAKEKTAKAQEERAKVREMFAREVGVWFGLSHPHVVRLFGACHVKVLFFACEFASNGSLDAYLRSHPDELWRKLYEAVLGVQYLHARGIVHGDLKCNNILVGADGKAKVTDFGLSSDAAALDKAEAQLTGAWHWVAPECLAHGSSRLSSASDVYSLGMCIVEALRVVEATAASVGGETEHKIVPLPWQHLLNGVVKHYVLRDRALPPRPSSSVCTDKQWTLVTRMCAFDESDRLSIGAVVDILGRLVGVDASIEAKADEAGEAVLAVGLEGVSAVVAEMKKSCIDGDQDARPSSHTTLTQIFGLLWSRLNDLVRVVDADDCSGVRRLWEFVDRARESTRVMLEAGGSESLIAFTETAMRGYALHRGLDKLIEANSWRVDSEGGGGVHSWQRRCNEFLGVAADTPGVNATAKALEVETEWKTEA